MRHSPMYSPAGNADTLPERTLPERTLPYRPERWSFKH